MRGHIVNHKKIQEFKDRINGLRVLMEKKEQELKTLKDETSRLRNIVKYKEDEAIHLEKDISAKLVLIKMVQTDLGI